MINKLAIIGVGLIGGSVGLEARRGKVASEITGWGRHRANLLTARKRGALHTVASSLEDAVTDADIVLLASPVSAICVQLGQISKWLKPGALVLDAGSTKEKIVKTAEKVLPPNVCFVGCHPMAGTEKKGAAAALYDLFRQKTCILTPTPKTKKAALGLAAAFWKKMGARIVSMSPASHDRAVATLSHLPQMISYVLYCAVMKEQGSRTIRALSGSGLRDTTRLASSPSEMWADIVLSNSGPLLKNLKSFHQELAVLSNLIAKGDKNRLMLHFEKIARARKSL